jgi:23S rRNA (uridine2552-2'-O)-methyltransferase
VASRRSTTQKWLRRQSSDPYVKQRLASGYRSRAAFKLKEILKRDRLLHAAGSVLDLGASPGGWTQVAVEAAGVKGKVLAVDILPMESVDGSHFIEGDCRESDTLHKIVRFFDDQRIDLVISDMAPNITGIRDVDEANFLELANIVQEIASRVLMPGGSMLIKLFHFPGTDDFVGGLRNTYSSIARRKPDSSRRTSREFYVVAKGFKI